MTERQIGSTYCMHYDTEAKFFLEDEHPSGLHHLVVHYVNGGHDGRPAAARCNGGRTGNRAPRQIRGRNSLERPSDEGVVYQATPAKRFRLLELEPMRPRTSLFGASADAEVIWNAIAAQLRACCYASQPLPANIDILLQHLISRETEGEAANTRQDNPRN